MSRTTLTAAALATALAWQLMGCGDGAATGNAKSAAETGTPAAGDRFKLAHPAPAFALRDAATGDTLRLADYKGRIVLLDFWATWCGPCKMEIPHLKELQAQFGEKGVQIIGVTVDKNAERVVPPFMEKNKFNYPVVVADAAIQREYGGIRSIPTAFLIDRNGMIRKRYIGYQEKKIFEEDFRALLGS